MTKESIAPQTILAIDPGLKGAWVIMQHGFPILAGKIPASLKIPVIGLRTGANVLHAKKLHRDLQDALMRVSPPVQHIVLEYPLSLPGQNCVATTTTGINWGILYTTLLSLDIPMTVIRPKEWVGSLHAKFISLTERKGCKDSKAKSLLAFTKLYPGIDFARYKLTQHHDGAIDATLMAFWLGWKNGWLAQWKQKATTQK